MRTCVHACRQSFFRAPCHLPSFFIFMFYCLAFFPFSDLTCKAPCLRLRLTHTTSSCSCACCAIQVHTGHAAHLLVESVIQVRSVLASLSLFLSPFSSTLVSVLVSFSHLFLFYLFSHPLHLFFSSFGSIAGGSCGLCRQRASVHLLPSYLLPLPQLLP